MSENNPMIPHTLMQQITAIDMLAALEGLILVAEDPNSPFTEMAISRARQAISKGKVVFAE